MLDELRLLDASAYSSVPNRMLHVVRGFHTSDRIIDVLLRFFPGLNKEAIIVEDLRGSYPEG